MVKAEIVDKPWGHEEILIQTNNYVMKKLSIRAGHRLSLQYHEKKEETIYVLSGILLNWHSEDKNDYSVIHEGGIFHCPPNTIHRFGADATMDVILLECSTVELHDVVRLADDYSRS